MENEIGPTGPKLPDPPRFPQPTLLSRVTVVGFGLLLVALLIGFLWQQSREIYGVVRPIQAYATYLKDHGAKTGVPAKAPTGVVGTDGTPYTLEISGEPVYLIAFDQREQKQKDDLKAIRLSRSVMLNDKPRPAKINGDLVLVGYDGRADEEKLVRAFAEFNQ